jgi:hypothetical protein
LWLQTCNGGLLIAAFFLHLRIFNDNLFILWEVIFEVIVLCYLLGCSSLGLVAVCRDVSQYVFIKLQSFTSSCMVPL